MYGTRSQLGLLLCLLGVWPGFFHVGREIRVGVGKEEEGRDEVACPSLGRASVISICVML